MTFATVRPGPDRVLPGDILPSASRIPYFSCHSAYRVFQASKSAPISESATYFLYCLPNIARPRSDRSAILPTPIICAPVPLSARHGTIARVQERKCRS